MRIISLLTIVLAVAVAQPAEAAGPFFPEVAFSATRTLTAQGKMARGPYAHSGGNERWEASIAGNVRLLVRRPDLNLSYAIDPALGMAQQTPLGDPIVFFPMTAREEASLENLGRETIYGEEATKFQLMQSSGKVTFWFTDDGIPMRILGEGDRRQFDIRITDVVRGPQPDELFEIPEGFEIVNAR